ncbi:MAG: SDR family NAD(P)-dependent oxidoreductase [Myxococcales bacterium]|nr:SDR family NAD(P)-dependent oxidoreductase [Myxococcales bacterium]
MKRATGTHEGFRARYGPWAFVAGGSEGLGAEFATQIAARGVNLVLLAPNAAELAALGDALVAEHGVEVKALALDLADPATLRTAKQETDDVEVGLLVYNAAHAWIGPFLDAPLEEHLAELDVNCRGPLLFAYAFGREMAARRRGGILLMSSLAGAQGAPGIANYAATKAYDTVLAEGLWGELRGRGVDVLACCAGATRTPGYLASRKARGGGVFSAPEMEPAAVVSKALAALGRKPSLIPGAANRVAAIFMQRLLPRRLAVRIMGRSTRGLRPDRA